MATLKLLTNLDCDLYVDQEFISHIEAGILHKEEISLGVYVIDLVSSNKESHSFDLDVEDVAQQFLKRVNFSINDNISDKGNNIFESMPDLLFYNGLARIKQNNLYGYINSKYEWVVVPQFTKAEHFLRNFAIVEKVFNGINKISLIDINGNNVIGGWFDEIINMNSSLVVIRRSNEIHIFNVENLKIENIYEIKGSIIGDEPIPVSQIQGFNVNKCGYINKKGDIILPFIYENVSNFSESGYAEVQRYGIKRFINKDGKVCVLNTLSEIEKRDKRFYILDDRFEWCGRLETSAPNSLFLSGCYRLAVLKDGKWGYYYEHQDSYNNISLYELFPCEYDKPFSDSKYGFVVMRKGRLLCVVNLVDTKYDSGDKVGQYVYGKVGDVLFSIEAEELYPFIQISGDTWFNFMGNPSKLNKYDLKKFIIKRNGKYGIVNKNGIFLTHCMYSDIYYLEQGHEKSHEITVDICIVDNNGVKELINSDGKVISNIKATEIFKVGKFWIVQQNRNEKHYIFDVEANIIRSIPFDEIKYGNMKRDGCGFYISGCDDYIIKRDNLFGVLNKEGNLLLDCKFSNISYYGIIYENSYRYDVQLNGKHGLYSSNGKIILECIFDTIIDLDDYYQFGYLPLINGKQGYYTQDGTEVLKCIYDRITLLTTSNYDIDLAVYKNNKCALFNCKKVFASDFIYDEIYDVYSEYYDEDDYYKPKKEIYKRTYKVRKGNKIGIINYNGEILVECK